LGLARQGMALVRYLVREGADVTVSDLRDAEALRETIQALQDLPVHYVLGEHPFSILDAADLLCLSGGVPLDAPIVVEAQRRGIPLSNDAQLFLERCPAPVIGITGSSGKTTTTSLVGRMLQRGRFITWVGGNIGQPLIDRLWEIKASERVVMELSSFQLELMSASPGVAAVLNVTPNHLDRHKTMAAYAAAKQRMLDFQTESGLAVLGWDDPGARGLAPAVRGRLAFFSAQREVETGTGAFLRHDVVTLRLDGQEHAICRSAEIKLLGRHNLLNVLAACVLAGAAGVSPQAIRQAATSFTGVAHRLELVRELNGVRYYDDSIATAPERTVAALLSFAEPIVLLAGGRDKDLPWEEMARLTLQRARHVVAFGEAGALVERVITAARNAGREAQDRLRLEGLTRVETLEQAVSVAAQVARPGDVVLLTPGGTSFDAFKDFVERGDRFQTLVRAL